MSIFALSHTNIVVRSAENMAFSTAHTYSDKSHRSARKVLVTLPANRRKHGCRYALCILNKSFCAQSERNEREKKVREHKTLDSHVTYYKRHQDTGKCLWKAQAILPHHEPTNRF